MTDASNKQTDASSGAKDTTTQSYNSFDDVLAACRNHNATSRREGLSQLVSFILREAEQTRLHLTRVISAIADRIVDPEAPVRAASVSALQTVLTVCPSDAVISYVPLLSAYLSSALSKLLPSLRLDALAHVHSISQVSKQT